LGQWDVAGGRYNGGNGEITLITKNGTLVAQGTKIHNHLYHMKMVIEPPTRCNKIQSHQSHQTFIRTLPTLEVWHRCFGHVGYTGLQQLLDGKMVDRFIVDKDLPKPDCVACTEAKQHIKPFPKSSIRNTKPGELMHIDLWGKYAIRLINGNQYYLLFVDDAKRFATIECIKKKSDAAQLVMNYLAHLKTHGRIPKGIQIDNGKEFVNEKLESWCKEHGMKIHYTALYSPSQNGIAEWMNHTLVELSQAMLITHDLPKFLWEYMVLHAAYICN
jgi:Integrase core domain/GAG-pre-integrase domain